MFEKRMKQLIRSFLDMIMLRKGADAIPSSLLVFIFSLGLLLISSSGVLFLIDNPSNQSPWINFLGYFLGISFYGAILISYGFIGRILQTFSAIIACGSLITIIFVLEFILFAPFIGVNLAGLLASFIMLWSVPVEGHLISSAIGKSRFFGIIIAIIALLIQFIFQANILNYLESTS
jgi:hypothetical protein